MEKTQRSPDWRRQITHNTDDIERIIDWINTIDKRLINKPDAEKSTEQVSTRENLSQVEQEIEAGLEKAKTRQHQISDLSGMLIGQGYIPVTRIYLPMAKYGEYVKSLVGDNDTGYTRFKFRHIPVFGYTGDEIRYCTD